MDNRVRAAVGIVIAFICAVIAIIYVAGLNQ